MIIKTLLLFFFVTLSLGIFSQNKNLQIIQQCALLPDSQLALDRLDSLAKHGQLSPNQEILLLRYAGSHAYNLGQFNKVDYYSTKGLFLSSKNKIYSSLGYFEMMQATSKYVQGKLNESIPGFKRAITWSEASKNDSLQISTLKTYGGVLVDLQKYDEAEKILKKGIGLAEKNLNKNLPMYLMSLRILATSYERQNRLKDAQEVFNNIEYLARKHQDYKTLGSILTHLSDLYLKLNLYKEANDKINEAVVIVKKTNNKETIHSVLLHKAQVLRAIGDYQGEVEAIREAYAYKIEVIDASNAKQINELETKYKLQRIRNNKQKVELKLKEETVKRRQYSLLFITAIILFALILFVIYFRNFKKKAKQAAIYREQKIASMLEGEENERTRIAKELHDGVVQDLTAVYHNLNLLKKLEGNEKNNKVDEIQQYVFETSTDVRNLSHQMMPIALRDKGLILAIEELFHKTFVPLSIVYSFDAFGLEGGLEQKIEISIYRIVQELLNNIVKHSNASEVSCVLRKKENTLTLMFEENGTGFDPNQVEAGLGLNSLQNRIDYLHGILNFESNGEKGLIAYVQIPLTQT
jgi:signal transduction histidine kinase